MIDQALIEKVQQTRIAFLEALSVLFVGIEKKSLSFEKVYLGSEPVKSKFDDLVKLAQSARIQSDCPPEFVCAFVGSSGDGKTSIISEMFPELAERKWLQTATTDTTSQALIIRQADRNSQDYADVAVHSWDMEQITRLVNAAKRENERHGIKASFFADYVEVDGSDATFDRSLVQQFKFGGRQTLRPLPRPYHLTQKEREDEKRIRTLTVKEDSDKVVRETALSLDGQNFHALQLRAVIKDVDLRESFERLAAWAEPNDRKNVGRLVFIDTPGLNIGGGSDKDEVLRYVLAKKNQQIIVELLRNDGLDLIVHLVLCGKKSYFSELWGPVEEHCDPEELGDLGDRLILAINGMNIFLTNDDLKRLWSNPQAAEMEGDHIATVLEDNILKKMSDRGVLKPARICFLDSRRIVESLYHKAKSYQEIYAEYRPTLESWGRPAAVGHKTLDKHGLLATYQANVNALCDPEDRGQGFLIRQIFDLLKEKGPKLYVRKYVRRNGLLQAIKDLRELLLGYYDADGRLNRKSIHDAVSACLKFIDPEDMASIELFAALRFDPAIERLKLEPTGTTRNWVASAFKSVCLHLFNEIRSESKPTKENEEIFRRYLEGLMKQWIRVWGYLKADLPLPTLQEPASGELVRHCLKFHAREILYQLLVRNPEEDALSNILQDSADQEAMKGVLEGLDRAFEQASALCRQYGVQSA